MNYKKGKKISCTQDAVELFRKVLKKHLLFQEAMAVIALDCKNKHIGNPWISAIGTVNQVQVFCRDIFREAIKRNAVSIIICHNHPSNELECSKEDINMTYKIKKAGKILAIPLLDHIIITKDSYERIEVNEDNFTI